VFSNGGVAERNVYRCGISVAASAKRDAFVSIIKLMGPNLIASRLVMYAKQNLTMEKIKKRHRATRVW